MQHLIVLKSLFKLFIMASLFHCLFLNFILCTVKLKNLMKLKLLNQLSKSKSMIGKFLKEIKYKLIKFFFHPSICNYLLTNFDIILTPNYILKQLLNLCLNITISLRVILLLSSSLFYTSH